ncbi:hypothetical protein RhiirA5_447685, partial [Rhizophagus irregularis]
IAQLLNNRIDLSYIPDHRIPYHYNVQHLIWQQIVRQPEPNFQEYSDNNIQPIFQEYLNNNANDASSVSPNSLEEGYNGVQSHQNN